MLLAWSSDHTHRYVRRHAHRQARTRTPNFHGPQTKLKVDCTVIAHTKEPSLNECIIYPTRISNGLKVTKRSSQPSCCKSFCYAHMLSTLFRVLNLSYHFVPSQRPSLIGYTVSNGPFRYILDTGKLVSICYNAIHIMEIT